MKLGDIIPIEESVEMDGVVVGSKDIPYEVVLITSQIILCENKQGQQLKFDNPAKFQNYSQWKNHLNGK